MHKPLTDQEWSQVEAVLFPDNNRSRKHNLRDIVEAIRYHAATPGCSWRNLPKRFPPSETVFYYFSKWGGVRFLYRLQAAISPDVVSTHQKEFARRLTLLAEELRHDAPMVSELLFSISTFTAIGHDDMIRVLVATCRDELGTIEGAKSPEVVK